MLVLVLVLAVMVRATGLLLLALSLLGMGGSRASADQRSREWSPSSPALRTVVWLGRMVALLSSSLSEGRGLCGDRPYRYCLITLRCGA